MTRETRQQKIFEWARAAFGEEEATNVTQRGLRLLEEAIELFQACNGNEEIAHKLVSFVFGRPSGSIGQELGGVSTTLLALAAAAGLSADIAEQKEVERVLSKPIEHFTERNADKNAAGFKISENRAGGLEYVCVRCGNRQPASEGPNHRCPWDP